MKRVLAVYIVFIIVMSGCVKQNNVPVSTAPGTQNPTPTPIPTPVPIVYRNPLTGLVTGKDISGFRPCAVMINDIEEALPQCGVSDADIIYEVVAEGGITRMLAVFQDISKAGKLGSIRSTRTYYQDIAEGHDAILIHAGGSTYAYAAFASRPIVHVDGIYCSSMFYRDDSRMAFGYEHSLFSSGKLIAENVSDWVDDIKHKEGFKSNMRFGISSALGGASAGSITVDFSGYKNTEFIYDTGDSQYHVRQFDEPYSDGNTGKQVTVKNVLLLYAKHERIPNDEEKNMDIELSGSGRGVYASDGKHVEIVWSKPQIDAQFAYTLKDGTPLVLAAGTSYICILDREREARIS